jgi:hypothetical protein
MEQREMTPDDFRVRLVSGVWWVEVCLDGAWVRYAGPYKRSRSARERLHRVQLHTEVSAELSRYDSAGEVVKTISREVLGEEQQS